MSRVDSMTRLSVLIRVLLSSFSHAMDQSFANRPMKEVITRATALTTSAGRFNPQIPATATINVPITPPLVFLLSRILPKNFFIYFSLFYLRSHFYDNSTQVPEGLKYTVFVFMSAFPITLTIAFDAVGLTAVISPSVSLA